VRCGAFYHCWHSTNRVLNTTVQWVLTQNTEKKYALVFNVNNLRDSKQEINFNTAYVNTRVIRYYYTVTETVFLQLETKYYAKCVCIEITFPRVTDRRHEGFSFKSEEGKSPSAAY